MDSDPTTASTDAEKETPLARRASLILEYGWMQVFELIDGGLTRDRLKAEQDRRKRIRSRQKDVDVATAALLRLPVEAEGRRATPSRVETISDLVAVDVLPCLFHRLASTLNAISDDTWKLIAGLRDLMVPREIEHHAWIFSLLDSSGRVLGIPGGYDPLRRRGDALPMFSLLAILRGLRKRGWTTISTRVCYESECEEPEADLLPGEDAIRSMQFDLVETARVA